MSPQGIDRDALERWISDRIDRDRTENAARVWERMLRELRTGRFDSTGWSQGPVPLASSGTFEVLSRRVVRDLIVLEDASHIWHRPIEDVSA